MSTEIVEAQTPGAYEGESYLSVGVGYGGPLNDHSGLVQRAENAAIELQELPVDRSEEDSFANRSKAIEDPKQSAFTDYPEGGLQAWAVVFGSWCAMTVTFGVSNTTGFLQAYLKSNQLKDYTESEASWIFSTYYFLCLFGGIQVGPIFDAYGLRFVILPGCIGMVASLFLTSFCEKYYQFLLAFGVLGGFSASMLFTPGIAVVSHWFYRKRGLATGIAASGGAVGGVVFPLFMSKLSTEVGYGWTIRTLAFIVFALCVGCYCTLKTRHPGIDTQPLNGERHSKSIDKSGIVDFKALKDRLFLLTTIGTFLVEFSYIIPMTYISAYAIAKGVSMTFSFQLLGILNAASIIGRSLPGFFADKWGRFNVMILTSFFCGVSCLAVWLPAGNNIAAIIVFAILFGFWSGTAVCLTPVCISQICRTEDFGTRYGTAYFFVSFGALFGLPVAGAFLKGTSGYENLIIFAAIVYLGGAVFFAAARVYAVGWSAKKVF